MYSYYTKVPQIEAISNKKRKICMAQTMIGYLKKYGDCPLTEMPMNSVDSLILCQLAYLKYDGLVCDVRDNGPSITVKEIAEHADFDKLFADVRFEKANRELFQEVIKGKRFSNMRLNCYINLVEKEWETQFSAVTFLLEDGTMYVAFRGTDESIVGWKEDFNMAYLSPIPAQSYSVKYLNMVTGKLNKSFYMGGHSKGGNLALYSAMNCIPSVQERILKIYNMDGPGFRPEILEKCGYEKIESRVVKILPQSSLVGMLFEQGMNYSVVASRRIGLAQHDPYTWLVEDAEFAYVDEIYEGRRFMDNTINEWILSLDEESLKTFIDTLYQVIVASEAEDLISFTSNWKKSLRGIMGALKEVDGQTADMIKKIIRSLFEIGKSRMRVEVTRGLPLKYVHYQSKKQNEQEEDLPKQA